MTEDAIIEDILRREGGFANFTADKGGPTNFGITIGTLSAYRKHAVSVDDVRALTMDEAREIYRQRYIIDPHLNLIENDMLRAFLVDAAVNHGPANAVRFLQHGLWVQEDGILGTQTLEKLKNSPVDTVYRRAVAERVRFYGRLITHDPTQSVFAAGWANRVAEFMEEHA